MPDKCFYGKILIFLFLAIWGINSSAFAAGTTSLDFLKMNMGSRAQGMGAAYTALSADINGIFYNPAGLAFSMQPALMFYHAQWIEDISVENLSILQPVSRRYTLSGAISFLHLPDLEGYDIDPVTQAPLKTGSFPVYDFVAQTGLSYRVSWNFSVGLQLKYLQERLDDVTASGMAFDLGILYKIPIDYLTVGAAIQNLGPNIKYENYREKLPLTYRIGAAYQFPYNAVTLSLDWVKSINDQWTLNPGAEIILFNSLFLRGGYSVNHEAGPGYSAGVGFKFLERYMFNYVYSPMGIIGNTHKAEIIINIGNLFSGNKAPKNPQSQIPELSDKSSKILKPEEGEPAKALPKPSSVSIEQKNGKVLLHWVKVELPKAKYNIYARVSGKEGVIKLNKRPLSADHFSLQPNARKISFSFYVTTVLGNRESDFTNPVKLEFNH
ncbi:MAG: PorV/PorQ family protein [Calditrichia bacterium]